MPELPEVEIVCRGLEKCVTGKAILSVQVRNRHLRQLVDRSLAKKLIGKKILRIRRRAKYILFDLGEWCLVNHLGMTGNWRQGSKSELGVHDHIFIQLQNKIEIIYNDPRRFGLLELIKSEDLEQHRLFKHLGVEPLSSEFNEEYLFKNVQGKNRSIKSLIMDQTIVVGIGNIYASESLFVARVLPQKSAKDLTRKECKRLVASIVKTLEKSLQLGGSSISDFRHFGGENGEFQNSFKVYDREGEFCLRCGTSICRDTLSGRSTYWCPQCQR